MGVAVGGGGSGASTGGTSTGGASTGGASTGGASTGGASTGGDGGTQAGGSAGAANGGSGGSTNGGSGGSTNGGSGGSVGGGGPGGSGGASGPFIVGGTVSGLLGSGLTLRNNGGDDLPVAKDGPFAFAKQLPSGASYAVSVFKQPVNPAQTCTVSGGAGTVGNANVTIGGVSCALADGDGDGIPDAVDPFPNDANKPQTAEPNKVYPHTASTLFTMDVNTYAITAVGAFNGSGYWGSMTDLAIDQYGVIYGVTFTDLYTCDAKTATCYHLASLPQVFNGLTLVPQGTIHPLFDTLVGIANSGMWYQVALSGSGSAQLTNIGGYGAGYSSSGDGFAIDGVGTFASVDKSGQSWDVIVSVSPKTGAVLSEIGPVTGYSTLYGLAGWQGVVFGFDESGAVLKIDTKTGATTLIKQTSNPWWGAGVATRIKK